MAKGPALLEYRDVYAGGRLVGSGSTDVITIVNPATEEVTGAVPSMVERDVDVAVAAARQAFDTGGWPLISAAERAAALDRLAAALEARAEDTARLVTAEMGMPITLSRRSNVSVPCAIIRYYAALARELSTEEIREAISFTGRTVVRRRAGWGRGGDRVLELSAHLGLLPAGPGAGGRLHGGAAARAGDLAVRVHPGRGV